MLRTRIVRQDVFAVNSKYAMTHFPHSRDINNRSATLAADLYLYEKRTVLVLFSIAESEGFEGTDIACGNPTSKPNKLPLAPCSKKKRAICLLE